MQLAKQTNKQNKPLKSVREYKLPINRNLKRIKLLNRNSMYVYSQ